MRQSLRIFRGCIDGAGTGEVIVPSICRRFRPTELRHDRVTHLILEHARENGPHVAKLRSQLQRALIRASDAARSRLERKEEPIDAVRQRTTHALRSGALAQYTAVHQPEHEGIYNSLLPLRQSRNFKQRLREFCE